MSVYRTSSNGKLAGFKNGPLVKFWTTYWENQSMQITIKYTKYSANPIMSSHIRIIHEKSNSEWMKLSHKEV
jgi:hypothetical protein